MIQIPVLYIYDNIRKMQDGIYRQGRDRRSKYLGIVFGGIIKWKRYQVSGLEEFLLVCIKNCVLLSFYLLSIPMNYYNNNTTLYYKDSYCYTTTPGFEEMKSCNE